MSNAIEKIERLPIAAEPVTPLAMIERAIANGANIETIERLMALHERYQAAEQRRAYDAAMHRAQAEIQPIFPNASNEQTHSKYATFAALDAAIRPIYTRHGLTLSFDTADGAPENHVRVTCEISHADGHHAHRHIDMPADGKGPKGNDVMTKTHATGSAISYGRRYLEIMIFNIAVLTKDDDGNAASGVPPEMAQGITADQYRELQELLEESTSKEADMLAYVKAESVEKMTLAQYAKAKAAMVNKIKLKKERAA